MDPKRLEEFRRMLREGRPVRVVDGRVVLADGPPDTRPPKDAPTDGVQVKPHEWGAAAAPSAPEPLPATARGRSRVQAEQALLAREYPGFTLDVDDQGTVYARGAVGPTPTLHTRYELLIVLPPGYGEGVMPQVHVLAPELRTEAPHRFRDGSLCLDHSGAFTARSTLVTCLAWVSVWLVLYEAWADTGAAW